MQKYAKIDLTDTTFMIPVSYDHPHRRENLELVLEYLSLHFDTNIVVMEHPNPKYVFELDPSIRYMRFKAGFFHRTKMLNTMARATNTPIIVNYDADVFAPPQQMEAAVDQIRRGCHMVFPFDGRFAMVERKWFKEFSEKKDTAVFEGMVFRGMEPNHNVSVGGAIVFDKKSFVEGGMENENMISYGREDRERHHRFKKLGYCVGRVPGILYHMEHWRGPNSTQKHPHFKWNARELEKVKSMGTKQLRDYVGTWAWAR